MKIEKVSVRYGELRSSGMAYNNRRFELECSAILEAGDSPESVKEKLLNYAKASVKKEFGDNVNQSEFDFKEFTSVNPLVIKKSLNLGNDDETGTVCKLGPCGEVVQI